MNLVDRACNPHADFEKAKHRGCRSTARVCVKALKQFALEKLPEDSPLRAVLIAEDDEMAPSEFIGAARTWLTLLRHTRSG